MISILRNVLTADEMDRTMSALGAIPFIDGGATAGPQAKLVKRNLQADGQHAEYAPLNKRITDAILRQPEFRIAARPRRITPLLFSRYRDGMEYGTHIDDPMMRGVRTDVSFTLFLSDPASYDGGELMLETNGGGRAVKLEAGQMVLYPSNTLHRVAPVTRGERLAAVGWCQSYVRDAEKRALLHDLDVAMLRLFQREQASAELDLIARCHANLVRMWADG